MAGRSETCHSRGSGSCRTRADAERSPDSRPTPAAGRHRRSCGCRRPAVQQDHHRAVAAGPASAYPTLSTPASTRLSVSNDGRLAAPRPGAAAAPPPFRTGRARNRSRRARCRQRRSHAGQETALIESDVILHHSISSILWTAPSGRASPTPTAMMRFKNAYFSARGLESRQGPKVVASRDRRPRHGRARRSHPAGHGAAPESVM